jgi:4-amino-4-deoxy-L-arabinose transferase-like glycosyltransferase|uniref:Uncharacterized protein n=1 Tax=Pleomorphic virus ThalV2 TaxID=3115753 RepID=A0AAT9JHB0_9VIRU
MSAKNPETKPKKKRLLPYLGLLLLILGIVLPTAIMGNVEYNIFDLFIYTEKIPSYGQKTSNLMGILESLYQIILICFFLSIIFGLLSLKFRKTVLITSFFAFLVGLFEIGFFVIFEQLLKQINHPPPFLGSSPFIFFIASAIFLIHHLRIRMPSKELDRVSGELMGGEG